MQFLRLARSWKGAKVYVEGRISMNEWQDQSGAKRFGLAAMANYSRLVQIRPDIRDFPMP
jgi:hypothetical protein